MRCSYCRQHGHNKTTCEAQTEYLRKRALNTDSEYWRSRYEERIAPRGRKMSSKACGYCRDMGHTRATCKVLVKDREWYVQNHNEMVGFVHNYLVSSHVGIGSLFKVTQQEWRHHGYVDVHEPYLLVDFQMPANLMTPNCQPLAILQSLSGKPRPLRKPIRRIILGQPDPSYHDKVELVTACTQVLDSDWTTSRMISLKDTKSNSLFKRVGRKREDYRSHLFDQLFRAKEIVDNNQDLDKDAGGRWRHDGAAKIVEEWKPANIYARMMKDYKNV